MTRQRRLSPHDRRVLRWLPMTMLFQRQTHQPARAYRELPQLDRLVRTGLVEASYDPDANALTLHLSAAGRRALAGGVPAPADASRSAQ